MFDLILCNLVFYIFSFLLFAFILVTVQKVCNTLGNSRPNPCQSTGFYNFGKCQYDRHICVLIKESLHPVHLKHHGKSRDDVNPEVERPIIQLFGVYIQTDLYCEQAYCYNVGDSKWKYHIYCENCFGDVDSEDAVDGNDCHKYCICLQFD